MCRVMKASFSRKVDFKLCLLSDCILLSSSSPPTNELTTANPEARINESPYPNELAAVIIDRPTDDSLPTNELTTANPEARINESPHPVDLVEVIIDRDTEDIPHTSELTGGTKEACIYKSLRHRL
ncbi:phosphatidylinositol 3,4,5-trisphosphate 3-phosphatase TPTE2-like isoform X1 [Gorilla gorilla gorilla]|uniref:phosphatidylinositol 3,4,5-trisphosphate 3-phosphatase TPTE2-like isoform X1 n=1 Tax=Gorilla gorilla gorilla TaxID=9595 RepID=UPI003008E516